MKRLLPLLFLASFFAYSCNKEEPQTDIVTSHDRALVIVKPDGSEQVCNIESVFCYPSSTSSKFNIEYCFFKEYYHQTIDDFKSHRPPRINEGDAPLIYIADTHEYHHGETIEGILEAIGDAVYEKFIEKIVISGLDESLGLGAELSILMQDGEYKGGNDLIDYVKVNSFMPALPLKSFATESNSDINIFIRCKSGIIISIRYINGQIPRFFSGYAY